MVTNWSHDSLVRPDTSSFVTSATSAISATKGVL